MNQIRSRRCLVADLPDPDPKIFQLLDAWKSVRGDALVPLKRDFDPLSIPKLLSSVWLYGLNPDGSDFTCRLAGENINRTWGGSIAGRAAKTLFEGEDHKIVSDIWHQVLQTPAIHYGKAEKVRENSLYAAERIVFPLRAEESDPTRGYVLGMSLYTFNNLDKAQPEKILGNTYHICCSDID